MRYFFSSPFGVVVLLELPVEPLLELLLVELPLLEVLLLLLELLLLVLELLLFLSLLAFSSAFGFSAGRLGGRLRESSGGGNREHRGDQGRQQLAHEFTPCLEGCVWSALARRIALKRIT